jgi:hypothetical protein
VTLTFCVFDDKYTSKRKFSNLAFPCENLVFPANGDKNHPARRRVRFTSIPTWRRAYPESGPVRNKEWGCMQRLRWRDGETRNQFDAQVFERWFSASVREQPCVVRFHRSSPFDAPSIGGSGEEIHKLFGFGAKSVSGSEAAPSPTQPLEQ